MLRLCFIVILFFLMFIGWEIYNGRYMRSLSSKADTTYQEDRLLKRYPGVLYCDYGDTIIYYLWESGLLPYDVNIVRVNLQTGKNHLPQVIEERQRDAYHQKMRQWDERWRIDSLRRDSIGRLRQAELDSLWEAVRNKSYYEEG